MKPADKILAGPHQLDPFARDLDKLGNALSRRIDSDPESVERGLAQLVLTVVELLRQLMERLGRTLMALESRMEELKATFGLEDEDLNLDLGPLGRLL